MFLYNLREKEIIFLINYNKNRTEDCSNFSYLTHVKRMFRCRSLCQLNYLLGNRERTNLSINTTHSKRQVSQKFLQKIKKNI